jgi:CubicO group peptidase (beta-lactamase class C family)
MSGGKLAALKDNLAVHKTKAFLVLRNDRVVFEWYADGHSASQPHSTASMAKAIVGGLSLAVALSDGRIALDDKAAKYVPQWKGDPRKSRITIRQLGSHTSGLADSTQAGIPHEKLPGWMGDFWKRRDPPNDPFTIARDRTPLLFDPGQKLQYSNPGIAMLTYAVTAALTGAPEKDVRTLLRDRVMRPIGVPDAEWSAGYGKTFTVDGLPLVAAWGGGTYTARAVARVSRLLLREGDWEGKRLLSREAVRQVTRAAGTPGHGGMGWWSNNGGTYPTLPRDAFWGHGAGDQTVLVVPSLKLIVVRNGGAMALVTGNDPKKYHDPLCKLLFEPLLGAVRDRPAPPPGGAPYPPSKAVTRVDWAPKETIVRRAPDSDNWPLTWADDGHLYTAYGDGTGFVPKVPEKLSLGLARVEGGPEDFTGINIRSATLEQKGNGKAGKKASGLLMVDGVLYLWARNAGNSQLAWSRDHGQTWAWSDWKFTTSFGYPAFLNFGKNYAGARDDYVYVYSQDSDSAYQPADRVVLARVPKAQIGKREAYEFFERPDRDGRPVWTGDVNGRGAVFTNPGKCYRVSISYNAGLKRYLLCQAGDDRAVQAGFGIFDAPEPWGPWTTAFHVPQWDVRPGETASLPTKWVSADGKTLYLVFSGGDRFNVRKATLTTATAQANPSSR